MKKKIITVFGARGNQGSSVLNYLHKDNTFITRAITRDLSNFNGEAHETVVADLNDKDQIKKSLEGSYGVFLVTNFWEGADEQSQAKNVIEVSKQLDIEHFVWSTLPDVDSIANGAINVPHFTDKSKVNQWIIDAKFKYHTFVQAPFYFQNLQNFMPPMELGDQKMGWSLPIDPTKKVIEMGDISEFGALVLEVFKQTEEANNKTFPFSSGRYSFNDVLDAYNSVGKSFTFQNVDPETYSSFYEGAKEITEMLRYFELHTYFGPHGAQGVKDARNLLKKEPTSLSKWILNTVTQ